MYSKIIYNIIIYKDTCFWLYFIRVNIENILKYFNLLFFNQYYLAQSHVANCTAWLNFIIPILILVFFQSRGEDLFPPYTMCVSPQLNDRCFIIVIVRPGLWYTSNNVETKKRPHTDYLRSLAMLPIVFERISVYTTYWNRSAFRRFRYMADRDP